METTKPSLRGLISTFKDKLFELEPLANAIDAELYESPDASVFQFEDYNINEGLELIHSILSRRIYYINQQDDMKEGNYETKEKD